MARGSIVKRCSLCRQSGYKCTSQRCSNKNVTYYAVYRSNGKQKWEAAGSTKKKAEKLLAKRLHEVNSNSYFDPKDIFFKDFANVWLRNCPKDRVKYTTFRGYQTNVNKHLIPLYGKLKLSAIYQEDIQHYLSQLRERLSARTVNDIRLTLYMILDYARSLKYLLDNPVKDIKPYKIDQKEMRFLNPEEIQLLLQHAKEPFKTLFLTAIFTGMRRGEILALKWGDIDWNKNIIFVRRGIYWYSKKDIASGQKRWAFTSPKSKRSIRAIVMSPRLKDALELHRLTIVPNEYDLVFTNSATQPILPENLIQRAYKPALRKAGLRKVRFHDLRHTHVALLIHQGENPKFIQRQLGHASIKTTFDRYGHLFPPDHVAVGSRFDEQVFGLSNNCLTRQAQIPSNRVYQEQVRIDLT